MNSRFALDKSQGKISGVCAGLARSTGIDPLIIRIAALVALFATGPIVILFYLIVSWLAD